MDPSDERSPLFRQRIQKEVDIVSILRVRILITYRKELAPDNVKQVGSTKIQVKRSDTIDSIVQGIRADNDVDNDAARAGSAVFETAKLTQGGIIVRGNQTAALLFEDRHSSVADADINFVYSYPAPVMARVSVRSVLVAIKGTRTGAVVSDSPLVFDDVLCNTTLIDFAERVRRFVDADSKKHLIGCESFNNIECYRVPPASDKGLNPYDTVKTLFSDPYKPEATLEIVIYYSQAPSSCCVIV
jgi:hypothetical protein